ncbi:uncharacterized protein LOC116351438 isoform X2 [Contarinia nasturtii]|uniref:uncharacterized protein LOC116351438 isoform X2 n=1 Tax=Contarinia nasturtii TaxID=265458 RepID=UPI0012D37970|nr:uncharacterized protein LOC116351438 isoform X2 [Contarinia nasturtii]
MDFILSKIISRSVKSERNDNCDTLSIGSLSYSNDNGFLSNSQPSFDIDMDTSKSSSGATHVSGKSPLALDSDISGIDADNTLLSGLDTTIDTSYKIENPNATFSDLISGLAGFTDHGNSTSEDLTDKEPKTESNGSFIISVGTQQNEVSSIDVAPEEKENPFKLPSMPTKTTNPFDIKSQVQSSFEVSDDEFQTAGLILNSNDFDFLLSRGCNSGPNNPRDSILERFDPILGRKSIAPSFAICKTEPVSLIVAPSVSTICEVDSVNETLVSEIQSPDVKPNETLNETSNNEQVAKLESIEKLDTSNTGGDEDNSEASSTTETYETASFGEQLKADVTMNVGLIHELKMDNMKSTEQDKEEPNLKMNDEHKVKQEMVADIERKLKEAESREEALLRRITEKEKALNKMSAVVENYEKTMVEMISEREQLTQNYEKQLLQLKTERDANFHHLTSLENTFSDLHVKYEKSKQMAIEVKESEAKLVEKLEFCQQQMNLQEQRYDKLKNHALSQLEG